jgi:hypothetical protein
MSVPSTHTHARRLQTSAHTRTRAAAVRAREAATLCCMRRCSRASAALMATAWLCAAILRSRCRHAHYQDRSGRCEHRVSPQAARMHPRTHAARTRSQRAAGCLSAVRHAPPLEARFVGCVGFGRVLVCSICDITWADPSTPGEEPEVDLAPATSAPGLGSPPHRHRDWARPHIGTGTGTGLGCERRR